MSAWVGLVLRITNHPNLAPIRSVAHKPPQKFSLDVPRAGLGSPQFLGLLNCLRIKGVWRELMKLEQLLGAENEVTIRVQLPKNCTNHS